MKKRLISLFLSFILILSLFSLSVSAEELPDSSHTHTWVDSMHPSFDGEVGGFHVTVKLKECENCRAFLHNVNINGMVFNFINARACYSLSGELQDFILSKIFLIYGKNATATKFEAGGGQPGTGGAGRYPSGYTSDGVPRVGTNGRLILACPHYQFDLNGYMTTLHYRCAHTSSYKPSDYTNTCLVSGSSLISTYDFLSRDVTISGAYCWYRIDAPVAGYYRVVPFIGSVTCVKSGGSSSVSQLKSTTANSSNETFKYFAEGATIQYYYSWPWKNDSFSLVRFNLPAYIYLEYYTADDPSGSKYIKQTNITINNNTWNGNIYQDTENNLTYIYPQYTTINDAGDTITNISENPIIYNSTTNQYYTYDSTTNNYYYITYVTATPSPEPTATPDPGSSGNTPTPTPGGGTSGGGSTSTPESGSGGSSSGQSWWSKLLDKLGNAIVDALLDAISTVLNLILKLFSTILGWIIWFASKSLDLLPFLPPGLSALLVGGVVVCFVIYIIKFIRG